MSSRRRLPVSCGVFDRTALDAIEPDEVMQDVASRQVLDEEVGTGQLFHQLAGVC